MNKVQLDDIKRYQFLSGLQGAPSGKACAFTVNSAGEKNAYKSGIYLYTPESGVRQMTTGEKEDKFLWQDPETLLFPAARTEEEREAAKDKENPATAFYRISIRGGEATKAFSIPLKVTGIQLVRKDLYLVTAACPVAVEEEPLPGDYQIIDELPFWSNGMGFTNNLRQRLYLYDAGTEDLKPITGPKMLVGGARIAEDGSALVYNARNFDGVMGLKSGFWLYDVDSGETRQLLGEETYTVAHFDLLQKEAVIFAGSENKRYGNNENHCLYRLDIATGAVQLLADLDFSYGAVPGSDCRRGSAGRMFQIADGKLYYIRMDGFHANLYSMDLKDGLIRQLTEIKGSVDMFWVSGNIVYLVAMVGLKLQELYALADGELLQLSGFNAWVGQECALSEPEHFSFIEAEGFEIDGWVMKPIDYKQGEKYPAILNIHGGPKAAFGEVFFHEMQYWAAQGYFVFFCNPRGGEGKGNDFAQVSGSYGTFDYDNLMQFTDLVLDRYPEIDRARLGVAGGSYGGFMTNWIIGHTDRFRAAASQRCISNWISFSYVSDIGYYFGKDQMRATAWDNPEKLWWHSPLKYADQVKTPTLFIHSDEDYRCWIPEAYQMFSALKLHGVDTRLCVFHGENHELSRSGGPDNRVKRLSEITGWFDKYLK